MKTMKALNILLVAAVMVVAKPPAPIAAPDPFQAGLGKVYEGYLIIQKALANDDFQDAKIVSESLLDTVKAIPTKGLDKSAKVRWDSSSAGMNKALHSMSAAKDIKSLRSQFMGLTPVVLNAMETFGSKSGSRAYLFHCPMANADWIQSDKTLANPFYGKSMECGEVVREVKKK